MSRPPVIKDAEEFKKLMSEHINGTSLANELGITKQAIEQYRRKFGIPAPCRSGRNEEIYAEFLKLTEEGETNVAMMLTERYEMSISSIYKILVKCKEAANGKKESSKKSGKKDKAKNNGRSVIRKRKKEGSKKIRRKA